MLRPLSSPTSAEHPGTQSTQTPAFQKCVCVCVCVCVHVHIYMWWEEREEFCAGTHYLLVTPRVSQVLGFMTEAVHRPSKPGSCHTWRVVLGPVLTPPVPFGRDVFAAQRHCGCPG